MTDFNKKISQLMNFYPLKTIAKEQQSLTAKMQDII
jgi:hypothetical protein